MANVSIDDCTNHNINNNDADIYSITYDILHIICLNLLDMPNDNNNDNNAFLILKKCKNIISLSSTTKWFRYYIVNEEYFWRHVMRLLKLNSQNILIPFAIIREYFGYILKYNLAYGTIYCPIASNRHFKIIRMTYDNAKDLQFTTPCMKIVNIINVYDSIILILCKDLDRDIKDNDICINAFYDTLFRIEELAKNYLASIGYNDKYKWQSIIMNTSTFLKFKIAKSKNDECDRDNNMKNQKNKCTMLYDINNAFLGHVDTSSLLIDYHVRLHITNPFIWINNDGLGIKWFVQAIQIIKNNVNMSQKDFSFVNDNITWH